MTKDQAEKLQVVMNTITATVETTFTREELSEAWMDVIDRCEEMYAAHQEDMRRLAANRTRPL